MASYPIGGPRNLVIMETARRYGLVTPPSGSNPHPQTDTAPD